MGGFLSAGFCRGLALALPLIITFWILYSIYDILHGWSKPVLAQIVSLVNELSDQPLLDINDPKLENFTNFIGFLFYDSCEVAAFTPEVQRNLTLFSKLINMTISQEIGLVRSLLASASVARDFAQLRDFETGTHL